MKPIAVSMGEPAGIGPEIIVAAWLARRARGEPFYVAGDLKLFRAAAQARGGAAAAIGAPGEAGAAFAHALPVLDVPLAHAPIPGKPDARNAKAVIGAIDIAAQACCEGEAAALLTAPIQKSVLIAAGFAYPGHTEYLAYLSQAHGGPGEPLMLLVGGGLKVALVTIHVPLREVAGLLDEAAILAKARLLAAGLETDFGIAKARIAVAAFNPHGGEAGALGREEIEIIAPAVAAMKREGIAASGPFAADTLFHDAARKRYDAALCMYHDQALIPLKTLDFTTGVNATLGLAFVRTSPDHGTALDIAGRGKADASSFIAALDLARAIAARRSA